MALALYACVATAAGPSARRKTPASRTKAPFPSTLIPQKIARLSHLVPDPSGWAISSTGLTIRPPMGHSRRKRQHHGRHFPERACPSPRRALDAVAAGPGQSAGRPAGRPIRAPPRPTTRRLPRLHRGITRTDEDAIGRG